MYEKYKFKRAYRKKKSYLVSYPLNRCLGKTKLIEDLAKKRKKEIITKHIFINRGKPGYIGALHIDRLILKHKSGSVFFVDGIPIDIAKYLMNYGYVLIGYID